MDRRCSSWPLGLLTLILAPVAAAMLLYQLDPYHPAPVPIHEFSQQPMVVPKHNSRMLQGSEMTGVGKLLGPEDIAYHPDSHLIYTGCADGWVKRVTLNDSMVQNWAFTGGRPLGVALGRHGQLIVADAEKAATEGGAFWCRLFGTFGRGRYFGGKQRLLFGGAAGRYFGREKVKTEGVERELTTEGHLQFEIFYALLCNVGNGRLCRVFGGGRARLCVQVCIFPFLGAGGDCRWGSFIMPVVVGKFDETMLVLEKMLAENFMEK
ncbi:Protein strictosidine synthase-like 4 [Vitis vinifera]|uniref:Protein strictosidine synthase-like 4 n=1 Tax=Vitis vinifera TaxID=29760 RepID=A0A438GEW0_VITVI|nr:Protein strictosidine synthase-like 4 [Vitis vinifera]